MAKRRTSLPGRRPASQKPCEQKPCGYMATPIVSLICREDFGHWRWLISGRDDVLWVTVVNVVRCAIAEC